MTDPPRRTPLAPRKTRPPPSQGPGQGPGSRRDRPRRSPGPVADRTQYGFASWPKLKAHVESLREVGQLKLAIDAKDLEEVKRLMTRHPELHRASLGYGKDGPLTWVPSAACRVPPSETRLAIARWMIENGSDIHQGGDAPLMRAALDDTRLPMTELLVAHGADVNALSWGGTYPIILAPAGGVRAPDLEMAARPRCRPARGGQVLLPDRDAHLYLYAKGQG